MENNTAAKKQDEVPEYTWQEISEHNTPNSCWFYVGNDVYDVTQWLPRHPGGADMILLFAGRDCTQTFPAYHPFSQKPHNLLEKYKVGKLKGPSELVRWKEDSGFYKEARERCAAYFKEHNIDPLIKPFGYECGRLGSSIVFFLFGFYILERWFPVWGVPFILRLLFTFPIAISGVMIAINVGHLCSHMPNFHLPRLTYYLGWLSWDFCLGLNVDVWMHEHVVGHHQYTNIITVDPNCPDNYEDALYRGTFEQKYRSSYYTQFIWLPLICFLLVFENRVGIFKYWLKGLRMNVRVNRHYRGPSSFFLMVLGKILFYYRMYWIPWKWWNLPLWEVCLYVQLTEMIAGYVTGMIFPANHITSVSPFPKFTIDANGQKTMDCEWAIMQMEVTKDYAEDSIVYPFVIGSLNNHTCHHLFPAVHHAHYKYIHPILIQVAEKHGIKLHKAASMTEFLTEYVKHLYKMGYEKEKDV